MNCPRPFLHFSPLPLSTLLPDPQVLLVGAHSPHLLKYLEAWPGPRATACPKRLALAEVQADDLRALPDAAFDLVVLGESSGALTDELLHEVLRVARQGLIRLR